MPRSKSLSRKEIEQLLKSHHRRTAGRFFSCIFAPAEKFKVGITVSKKVALRANKRNLVKRRYRSLAQKLAAPVHLLIAAKKGAAEASFSEIADDFHPLSRTLS